MGIVSIATLNIEFTRFCNTLRCPLCESQLDGNIHPKEANLYCAGNNTEYKCLWYPGDDAPVYEQLIFWYPQYQYEIIIRRVGPNTFDTSIDQLNLDLAKMYRNSSRKQVFHITGSRILFFRKRMEEDVFLRKLKTYNVFS